MIFQETEIIIDFPFDEVPLQTQKQALSGDEAINEQQTNVASNRAMSAEQQTDPALDRDLERARELLKDVSKQLSKEIPTVDDLRMPVKSSEGLDPDSLLKRQYTGESNVEYYLENRYHLQLPIPVYLSQSAGKVQVNILVDATGRVLTAQPVIESNISDQLLSYAKTAALRTRFNPTPNNTAKQKGYIIYRFIAQ
jgi:outer membrane biosynthesis protein TonB